MASGDVDRALEAEQTALGRLPEGAALRMVALLQRSVDFYRAATKGRAATEGLQLPGLLAP